MGGKYKKKKTAMGFPMAVMYCVFKLLICVGQKIRKGRELDKALSCR